jgi:hypothetical protein
VDIYAAVVSIVAGLSTAGLIASLAWSVSHQRIRQQYEDTERRRMGETERLVRKGVSGFRIHSPAPREITFANESGNNFHNIDHTGVITKVVNGYRYITQHSDNRQDEPMVVWIADNPHLTLWVVIPNPG